jgi:hypothetical protein
VSPPRQGLLLWEMPTKQELPQAVQTCCRELLSHMLLAAMSGTTGEESDEREDKVDPYRA